MKRQTWKKSCQLKAEMKRQKQKSGAPSKFQLSVFYFQLFFYINVSMSGRLGAELRARAKRFGSQVIHLYMALPKQREEVRILGKQLIRSATSVPSHVREASRARSTAEFRSKLGGALQEADESQLWLEYLHEDCGIRLESIPALILEADELIAIFTTMIKRSEE